MHGKSPLERLDAWLRAKRASYHASLGKGATPAELTAIEKAVGEPLPAALGELLRWKTGGKGRLIGNWSLMRSGADVAAAITELGELLEAGDFDAPSHWSPKWVPFLENGGGDHVCVDIGASFGGAPGQVLEFWHSETMRPVLAPSLDAWLDVIVTAFEAGGAEEESGGFFEPASKALKAARAKLTPGYPKSHESSEPAPKAPAKKAPVKEKAPAAKGAKPSVPVHPRALPTSGAQPPLKTTTVATLPKRTGRYGIAFALSGARWAYTLPEGPAGEPEHVVCDGDEGPGYEHTGVPTFVPDGRLTFFARVGKKKWTQLVGDATFGPYDGVGYPVFSADGAHVAFRADKGKQAILVVDGVATEVHDQIERGMFFAPDGRLAVAVADGDTWRVELGGRTVAEHAGAKAIRDLTLSPDGKHVAYRVVAGSKHTIIVDGKAVTTCPQPQLLGYSPRGELYWAVDDDFVLGEDRRDDERVEDVFFLEDGSLYARVVRDEGGAMSVRAGKKELATMKCLHKAAFHAATRRLAFEVIEGNIMLGPHFVVVGDAKHGPFKNVTRMTFSPDGSTVSFGALDEALALTWHVVPAR